MRALPLLALVIALLLPTATAAPGTTGPFVGLVVENQTNAHLFVSQPQGMECILPVWWIVQLHYSPPSDVLTLKANGLEATGSNGFAQVAFEGACSTSFLIFVTGTDVALVASYVASVGSSGAPPQ